MTTMLRAPIGTMICLILALPVVGQVSVTQRDVDGLLHWAYSAAFGTGFYRVGDNDIYVLRVEPAVSLDWLADRGIATKLRLPFTFGLQSIDLGDIGEIIDLSNNLTTVTFVPGLEFEIPIRGSWVLKPFAHYGYGHQLSGSESSQIYYFGLNSEVALPALGAFEIHMINGLQWFGQSPAVGRSEIYARLLTGFEGNMPLGSWKVDGRQLYLKPHIAHYWYFEPVLFRRFQAPATELDQVFEIALAVGIEERISLKVFSFDRFGIAYKVGADFQGFRIFFSSVFQ